MSSNFIVKRICEYCKEVFEAKTTVTRFCSKLCNKRSYKQKYRDGVMADMNKQVIEVERSKEIDINSLEFLSVKNTAKLLGVSNKMVYTLIKTGQIQASNLSSRKIIISRLAIDNLLALKEIEVEPRITKELEVSLKDCYYMAEAQEKYNISEGALYRIIKRNDIGKHKSGKYTYVKKTALENVFNPIELCQK